MDLEADPDSLIGEVVASRYRVEARLGHGAMGTVYRARHVKVGRAFAIKVLHPQFLAEEKGRRRFAREAELAGSLDHPNIATVVDAGETPEGLCYLVMEYIDGITLFELIRQAAPMPAARVLSIVRLLCGGLAHAHERGLIHRDFKTENVIIERDPRGVDVPKIVDFGIAILRDEATSSRERLTTAGLVLGTPHYMAPEHATGAAIDHRIDLFALGVMCFEMLTGRPPFDGDGVDVARANLLIDTPVMSVRVPGLEVDPLLEALTRKLMMKSRDARPATAGAVLELLDLIDRDRPAAAAALCAPLDGVRASTSSPSSRVTAIPGLIPERAQSARHLRSGPVASDPTQLTLHAAAIAGAPLASEVATTAPSAPHAAPWASGPVVRDTPSLDIAPWVADETAQIASVPSQRRALAIAAVAGLAVLVALILAVRPHRARSMAPTVATPTLPAAAPIDAGDSDAAAAPAPVATAPEPAPAELPAQTVAKPPRVATRAATTGKPATPQAAVLPASDPAPVPSPSPQVEPQAPEPPPSLQVEPQAPGPSPITAETSPTASPERRIALAQGHPVSPIQLRPAATPARVAQLYATVGQQLKALDQTRGSAATADLWLLYLRVRINDVIANPVKCAAADALLHHLDDEVVRRSH